MKKSELNFKCVVPVKNVSSSICRMLGIKSTHVAGSFVQCKNGSYAASSKADVFCSWPEPLMSYEDAIKLIESIEPDAPEFDIKPFDKVLWKQKPKIKSYNDTTWHVDFYAGRINVDGFACIGNTNADCLLFCNADTLELNNSFDYPAGWWECENGKPVWRTK
jgi:hypothetical protein